MFDLLIEAETLRRQLTDPDYLIFDVRSNLMDPQIGEAAYRQGHIPGAYFLDQNEHLAGTCTGANGRHPLPDFGKLRRLLQQCGLTPASKVVVYDQNDASYAARAWWLFRWLGHSQVAVLNGGMQAWLDADGPVQTVVNTPLDNTGAEESESSSRGMPVITADTILARQRDSAFTLVDARTPERYRGETEPIDPVAGRIEGAVNRPIARNVESDGRFKSPDRLHAEFSELLKGWQPSRVVHYCGSGITACHNVFAMELAGLEGSHLYPGSWSEWCSDPQRPVAKG